MPKPMVGRDAARADCAQALQAGQVLALIGALVGLPIEWYRQFRLEQRFGFNRMTQRLFVADALKGAAIAAALVALAREGEGGGSRCAAMPAAERRGEP